ncbi:hypothetical protein ACFT2C_06290 [Promicromonospora sp. NPDC057138]|uniref:hypothetical protein n=1 Tax=Promicromonospora sp. NPDC057138 TaxID=3346031 RepID=UPI0036270250
MAGTERAVGVVRAAATIDLDGSWDVLWGSVIGASGMGRLADLASVVGVAMVVVSIVGWIWQRRRRGGGGGRNGGLIVALIIGAILAGPNVLLPRLLWIADALVNAFVSLLDAV